MAGGRERSYRIFSADFETTVYEGQTDTQVWASALVELHTENVQLFGSIWDTWDYLLSLNDNLILYYHNLKFDGSFWLDYFLRVKHYKQAMSWDNEDYNTVVFDRDKEMPKNSFRYVISNLGQWYSLKFKTSTNKIIELRDSMKLMPFSVREIGKAYKTKHQKLDMEYTGFRYPNCPISEEEQEYIKNDVLVVKEALEIMFAEGHTKLTIGACCLEEFIRSIGLEYYEKLFPDLTQIELDESYGATNIDSYIRKSYHGGWCYLARGKENKVYGSGTTADVNSLYPSMMSSESGNRYPVGYPTFWQGDYIPDEATMNDNYYFIRFRTRFYLKKGKLPFIQIKRNYRYNSNEMLETSDVYQDGEYHTHIINVNGERESTAVVLTMTCTDFKLFLEHYNTQDFEVLDGCFFQTEIGIFDKYIEKYKKQKLESTGALRTLAKLFLNNLYGKMSASTDSSFKYAHMIDENIHFETCRAFEKRAGFIPVGSAITSYARNFTIRAAQMNYHGVDKAGFIYADTDSIHCDLPPDKVKGIKVHDKNFCCWKLEACWDSAIFVRQKTYIEHVVMEDLEEIENPYYNVKCAGMPERSKSIFIAKMLKGEAKLDDFKIGLTVEGKLLPKRIKGGVLLKECLFTMR